MTPLCALCLVVVYPHSMQPRGYRPMEQLMHPGYTPMLPMALTHDRMAYVDYRKGEDVYWTGSPVVIRAGEIVWSDGISMKRGRCGNDMAPTLPPGARVEAWVPPMDIPEVPDFSPVMPPPTMAGMPPVIAPVTVTEEGGREDQLPTFVRVTYGPAMPATGGSAPIGPPPVGIVPLPPAGEGGGFYFYRPDVPRPVVTPEVGTWLMVLGGLAAVGMGMFIRGIYRQRENRP